MIKYAAYYRLKRLLPRSTLLWLRRIRVSRIRSHCSGHWPIDPYSDSPPKGWTGWPEEKKFAVVLTHDVESSRGRDRCLQVAELEERHGFRSSFNFVVGDYPVPAPLRSELQRRGFEIGIHGFHHNDNAFRSDKLFRKQAKQINAYLEAWSVVGFRAPSMFHDLDMIKELNLEYDCSTFDTDPFEPQPDGLGTVFPVWISRGNGAAGFVEMPYTMPQDFLLFTLMREGSIRIWEKKLEWLAGVGGMVLVNTHPDYFHFDGSLKRQDEYPRKYYEDLLTLIKTKYEGQYWHALPKDVALFWKSRYSTEVDSRREPLRICMPLYNYYESDNRVMRYAEALADRGDHVEVLSVGKSADARFSRMRGVSVYRIATGKSSGAHRLNYFLMIIKFFGKALFHITRKHLKKPYDLIHVHSVPDFLVLVAALPKLSGSKIILDIHDIVPEFYASKYSEGKHGLTFRLLEWIELIACRFSDHVIASNHLWMETIVARSVKREKATVVLNFPDERIFYSRPKQKNGDSLVLIYPGTLAFHQGVDLAIEAFAIVNKEVPGPEFHIYGDGPEKERLIALIEKLKLSDKVFIRNGLPLTQIADVMANADIGIVPKRNDPFGGSAFSTKMLEFMSVGIPVIASRTKIDDFYFNDSVVKFFKPDDVDDLARCMRSLIMDKDERARLIQNGQLFVESFLWRRHKDDYYELVDKLVLSRNPHGGIGNDG